MTRFLRYSMERGRKIRAVLTLNGRLAQRTVLVVSYDDQTATFSIGRSAKPVTVPLTDILGCDYARGDDGGE